MAELAAFKQNNEDAVSFVSFAPEFLCKWVFSSSVSPLYKNPKMKEKLTSLCSAELRNAGKKAANKWSVPYSPINDIYY